MLRPAPLASRRPPFWQTDIRYFGAVEGFIPACAGNILEQVHGHIAALPYGRFIPVTVHANFSINRGVKAQIERQLVSVRRECSARRASSR